MLSLFLRLLKDSPNRNSCNIKKKSRSIYNSPTHIENAEYASDGYVHLYCCSLLFTNYSCLVYITEYDSCVHQVKLL